MPFRSEKQRRYLWANEPKIAREWTDEYGSKPVKAKAGKYQDLKHPQHDILPLEHMEEKVSSKERVERLLDERKNKKESKKKLAKEGPHYVPGWKPNLSVKAAEGELIRQKTRGTGAAVKGTEHYTMKGMPTAYQGQLIQTPTRGTGAAVKGTDHYIMPGMDAAKTGKLIKAKESKWITVKPKKTITGDKPDTWDKSLKNIREIYKIAKENKKEDRLTIQDLKNASKMIKSRELMKVDPGVPYKTGGPIKAKKGYSITTGLKGYDVKKVSKPTSERLFSLYRHRERGGFKQAKEYQKYLKNLKKVTTKTRLPGNLAMAMDKGSASKKVLKSMSKTVGTFPAVKSKSYHFKDAVKPSTFLQRRVTLGGTKSLTSVLKAVGKRTGIGKAVAAATVVAGAYEAGKRKLFTKDKKKIDKKSIGGETVVMKSGGGYIDNLL